MNLFNIYAMGTYILQVLDILKSVKLTMLQTQSFAPRDVVDVLKSLPEKDLREQLEVRL